MTPEMKKKLSDAIDMITDSIDGRMLEELQIAKAVELLCELWEELPQ